MIYNKKITAFLLIVFMMVSCSTAKRIQPSTSGSVSETTKNQSTILSENKPSKEISPNKSHEELIKKWFLVDNEIDNNVIYFNINKLGDQLEIKGFSGCNSFNGDITLYKKDQEISITNLVSTKKSCENLSYEYDFLALLSQANRYDKNGDELTLFLNKIILLRFKSS